MLRSHMRTTRISPSLFWRRAFFSRDATTIPQIGARWGYEGLIEDVFDMEVGVIKVIEAKKRTGEVEAYFVSTVLEKKPAAIPPFAEVKTEVIEAVKEEKTAALALADAQSLFNQHVSGESLEELLKKYKAPEDLTTDRLSVQESNLFSLSANSNYISGMGNSAEAMFAAFRMENR